MTAAYVKTSTTLTGVHVRIEQPGGELIAEFHLEMMESVRLSANLLQAAFLQSPALVVQAHAGEL